MCSIFSAYSLHVLHSSGTVYGVKSQLLGGQLTSKFRLIMWFSNTVRKRSLTVWNVASLKPYVVHETHIPSHATLMLAIAGNVDSLLVFEGAAFDTTVPKPSPLVVDASASF